MKKEIIILLFLLSNFTIGLLGQNIELSFTGDNNGQLVLLDSVKVENLSQTGGVMLYPPDLSLELLFTDIEDRITETNTGLSVSQNYPNPFSNETRIKLHVPGTNLVKIVVSNLLGQNLLTSKKVISAGMHTFLFTPGKESSYFLTADFNGYTKTIKMLCASNKLGQNPSLKHTGQSFPSPVLKAMQLLDELPFEMGDDLLMIAYSESDESAIVKSPDMSQEYVMQFATNIPCIGNPTVEYEGQTYNAIQIYSQCWLKENLNVGVKINATESPTNNDTIEKYCPLDNEYYCSTFAGALYSWSEMMNYSNEPEMQGICPDGWYIPSDLDWQILEGAVDSIYGIGNPEWSNSDWRGSDAGGKLKQNGTTMWAPPNTGATDAFDFSALPGGYIVQDEYWGGEWKGYFWSSDNSKYYRNLDWNQAGIQRNSGGNGIAFSVRCVKD